MQVSKTAGYATIERHRPGRSLRRFNHAPWRNRHRAVLRPERPARPNARRAAIAESMTAA